MNVALGIFPASNPSDGGAYQYGSAVAEALRVAQNDGELGRIVTVLPPEAEGPPPGFEQWPVVRLESPPSRGGERVKALFRRAAARGGAPSIDSVRDRRVAGAKLRSAGIGLVLYAEPQAIAFELGVPYVMPIHDLQHRLQPWFPEVSANGEFERREYLFRNGARFASAILVDSEVGKEDVLDAYADSGLEPERIHVLPFVAPPTVRHVTEDDRARVRRKYELPAAYLFYPAQFWPHKNHARLAEAVAILRDKGVVVDVVLAGSSSGELRTRTMSEFLEIVRAKGIEDRFRVLGYVEQDDIGALYANARGLVFPTFFGPTNLPILEAWALDCPVMTSDVRGVREQVGDAAVLADPRSSEDIARAVELVWTDADLRTKLVRRGRELSGAFTPAAFRERLVEVVRAARELGPPRSPVGFV